MHHFARKSQKIFWGGGRRRPHPRWGGGHSTRTPQLWKPGAAPVGGSKKLKTGKNFFDGKLAKNRNTHNTKCDNSAMLQFFSARFARKLLVAPIITFVVPPCFLLLLLKLHWIWSVNCLQHKVKLFPPDAIFNDKMHQIRFRLGLRSLRPPS